MSKKIVQSKIPPILNIDENEGDPKVVKTYRINQQVFNVAESRCQKTHGCGVSSIIDDLLIAYFNIKTTDL